MNPSNLTAEVWPVTDKGQVEENEDFVLLYRPTDPEVLHYSGSLYIVADGLGGGQRGKMAARYAAQRVMQVYYESLDPDLGLRLRLAVEAANADLYDYAQAQPQLVKMGATLVAAAIRGEQLHVAAVGDSRAYLIREGEIERVTRDHTLVQQLLDEEAITPEEAVEHPRRDVVLRMLGADETINVDIFDLRLRPDDTLLLCSDGLTRHLRDEEIVQVVSTASPRSAAEKLVQKALDRGGKDNVSVIAGLLRDGAPPLETDIPYTWDETRPTFEEQPTLVRARIERPEAAPPTAVLPTPQEDATLDETVRVERAEEAQPVERPPTVVHERPTVASFDTQEMPTPPPQPHRTEPAPVYQQPVQPAPPYGTQPQPPGYVIDPVTGLPPVPGGQAAPDRPAQVGYYQQPGGYAPRVYQPPGQPNLRPRRRGGISLGTFALVALLAVVLTAIMVVVLVNPFGWQLPFTAAATTPTAEQTAEVGGATTAAPPADQTALPPSPELPSPTPIPTTAVAPPGMVLVESGAFMRGVGETELNDAILSCIDESRTEGDPECIPGYFTDAQPQVEVSLSAFFIDITEVTNVDYAACVAADVCTPPSNQTFYTDPAYAQHPVVYVSWTQASAYCEWAGKRLPTEAEWEKAARWDPVAALSYVYPWGDNWEPGRANTAHAGLGGTAAVQAFDADLSPWGVLGMTGNVAEWVQDWYYPGYGDQGTLNPTGPERQPLPTPERAVRGGWFGENLASYVRAAHRLSAEFDKSGDWLGFRCVADAEAPPPPPPATPTPTATETVTPDGGDQPPTEPTDTPTP